jgi:hypothetical protein
MSLGRVPGRGLAAREMFLNADSSGLHKYHVKRRCWRLEFDVMGHSGKLHLQHLLLQHAAAICKE